MKLLLLLLFSDAQFYNDNRNDNSIILLSFDDRILLIVFENFWGVLKHAFCSDTIPCAKTKIDYVLIRRRWRSAISDISTKSHDLLIDSDHKMLKGILRTKLKVYMKPLKSQRLALGALNQPTTARKFTQELRRGKVQFHEAASVNEKWESIKKSLNRAAEKCLEKTKLKNNYWITQETLNAIKTRENL